MLFDSISFAIFLPVIFILYWFVAGKNLKLQNMLLLISSYFFYISWNYKFLFLLIFSTLLNYYSGIKIDEAKNNRVKRLWLLISIFVNLGFLGLFKYYSFFVSSFVDALSYMGVHANLWTLNIILPVGISFYTFQGMSYVFDVYNKKKAATRNFVEYSVFVSFFPLLIAGPIERANHLLPQIEKERQFDYLKAVDGLKQILWGLFKKVVIADQCVEYVNMVFNNPNGHTSSTLVLGAILFAFQIYADFSGMTIL